MLLIFRMEKMSQNILVYFLPIPQLVSCTHTPLETVFLYLCLFLPFPGPTHVSCFVLTLFLFILIIIFGLVLIKSFME